MGEIMQNDELINEEKDIIEEEKGIMKGFEEKLANLSVLLERSKIDEYTSMITRPWKFFLFSFISGLVRGLGFAIGMTIVFAILAYVLSKILMRVVDLPVIGAYVAELIKYVEQYLQKGVPIR